MPVFRSILSGNASLTVTGLMTTRESRLSESPLASTLIHLSSPDLFSSKHQIRFLMAFTRTIPSPPRYSSSSLLAPRSCLLVPLIPLLVRGFSCTTVRCVVARPYYLWDYLLPQGAWMGVVWQEHCSNRRCFFMSGEYLTTIRAYI